MNRLSSIKKAFNDTKDEMLLSLAVVLGLTVVLSLIFYIVESAAQPDVFTCHTDALVWAYTRYIEGGDGVFDGSPVTVVGKVIASLFGFIGIAIVAIPAGLIGSGFMDAIAEEHRMKELADARKRLKKQTPETLAEYRGHEDDIPGLFGQMDSMPGAIDAVHKLAEKYDCYILSTAPWANPSSWADKVRWVTEHLDDVFHKKVILTHHKNMLNDVKAYLIDDRTKHGADQFGERHIHFGSDRFPDWERVVDFLLNK